MLSTHLSLSEFFYRPRRDLMQVVTSRVIRKIAVLLISLFSPIYIYQVLTGKGFLSTHSIVITLFYYAFSFLVKMFAQIYSEDLSRKIGFKNVIRLSMFFFLLFIPTIILAEKYLYLFALSSALLGIHAGLFWWGYHGYFVKKETREHLGESLGEADFLETTAVIVTPFLGGLVTAYFGFEYLFILSGIFIFFAFLVLGKGSKTRQVHDIEFSGVLSLIRKHNTISLAYIGIGGEAIISIVVWPMFLFLFFQKVISLGTIVSLASFLAAIFAVVVGRWTDRQGERKIVRIGSPLLFVSWLMRFFLASFSIFVVSDSLRNLGQKMVVTPLNALSYKKALEAESAKAILFYETNQVIGVVLALMAIGLLVYLGFNLSVGFIIASIFAILPVIAVIKKKLRDLNE